ncbi:actin- protein 3 [Maublancomyces gigas]|uniref:Actin- protein 3 n=1 Tax=Discina gigas TaxID=1032678 RepID=A0ABR3GGW3_9PEZI
MTDLLSLSNELLVRVGDFLGDKDLSHFMQTGRLMSQVLSASMLKRALEDKPPRLVNIHSLTWAIEFGHVSLVKTIVHRPEFTRFSGGIANALHHAASLGHCEIMSILMGAGYWADEKYAGNTPLHCSAMNGHPEAVKLLINNDADITKRNDDGMTAFNEAISSPTKIFEKHRKINPGALSDKEEVDLKFAIENRVVAILRVLVQNGAYREVFARDGRGATAAHLAVEEGFSSKNDIRVGAAVLKFLFEHGANLNAIDHDQFTPIALSIQFDIHNIAALNYFLELGINPNQKNASGVSLLKECLYADLKALPCIELLLSRGATTDDLDMLSFFRLEYPDLECLEKIVILLLIHGLRFGSDSGACFTLAAVHGSVDLMKVVYQTGGVDINTSVERDANETTTALEIAIEMEHYEMLEYLVELGVEMPDEQKVEVEQILGISLDHPDTSVERSG